MTDFLRLLKDDAYAATFQTLGQYRTALIAAYRDCAQKEVDALFEAERETDARQIAVANEVVS